MAQIEQVSTEGQRLGRQLVQTFVDYERDVLRPERTPVSPEEVGHQAIATYGINQENLAHVHPDILQHLGADLLAACLAESSEDRNSDRTRDRSLKFVETLWGKLAVVRAIGDATPITLMRWQYSKNDSKEMYMEYGERRAEASGIIGPESLYLTHGQYLRMKEPARRFHNTGYFIVNVLDTEHQPQVEITIADN